MHQGRAPVELAKILETHDDEIESLGEEVIRGDKEKVAGAFAGLLTSLATGSPMLGSWANAAVQKAFVPPATRRLLAETAKYDKAKSRECFIADIREEVQLLIEQAIVQAVRSQHNIKDELLTALGELREDLTPFLSDFERALPREQAQAIQRDLTQAVRERSAMHQRESMGGIQIGKLEVHSHGIGIQQNYGDIPPIKSRS